VEGGGGVTDLERELADLDADLAEMEHELASGPAHYHDIERYHVWQVSMRYWIRKTREQRDALLKRMGSEAA
jgi:hypothetical protein